MHLTRSRKRWGHVAKQKQLASEISMTLIEKLESTLGTNHSRSVSSSLVFAGLIWGASFSSIQFDPVFVPSCAGFEISSINVIGPVDVIGLLAKTLPCPFLRFQSHLYSSQRQGSLTSVVQIVFQAFSARLLDRFLWFKSGTICVLSKILIETSSVWLVSLRCCSFILQTRKGPVVTNSTLFCGFWGCCLRSIEREKGRHSRS